MSIELVSAGSKFGYGVASTSRLLNEYVEVCCSVLQYCRALQYCSVFPFASVCFNVPWGGKFRQIPLVLRSLLQNSFLQKRPHNTCSPALQQ